MRRQIVQQAIELREDLPSEDRAMADEAPGAIFRQRLLTALNDPTWVRFVTWEALDYPRSRRIARQDRRQLALHIQRNAIIAKQFHGLLPKTVKAELLLLALYALATYPLAYAPITRMVTSKLPSDPKFQQEWMAFLDPAGGAARCHSPSTRIRVDDKVALWRSRGTQAGVVACSRAACVPTSRFYRCRLSERTAGAPEPPLLANRRQRKRTRGSTGASL